MTRQRRNWTREETLEALALYLRTPFGRLHARNPEIIRLAERLGRTPAAVALKASNFAALDDSLPREGMSHTSALDEQVWEEFLRNPEMILPIHARQADPSAPSSGLEEEQAGPILPRAPQETERIVAVRQRLGQDFFRRMVSGLVSINLTRQSGGESPDIKKPHAASRYFFRQPLRAAFSLHLAGFLPLEIALSIPCGQKNQRYFAKNAAGIAIFIETRPCSWAERCPLTGIEDARLLNASHIVAWKDDSANRLNPRNGICLNTLHDRAFDRHLITFDEDMRLVIAPDVPEQARRVLERVKKSAPLPTGALPTRPRSAGSASPALSGASDRSVSQGASDGLQPVTST